MLPSKRVSRNGRYLLSREMNSAAFALTGIRSPLVGNSAIAYYFVREMTPSHNKSRFLALGLGFACLATQLGVIVTLMEFHKVGGHPGNVVGLIVLLVLAGVIPVGFSFLSAVLARNFDRVSFITALVPAAAMFVASYAWGVHESV